MRLAQSATRGLESDDAGATLDAPQPLVLSMRCKGQIGEGLKWLQSALPARRRLALEEPWSAPPEEVSTSRDGPKAIACLVRPTAVTMVMRRRNYLLRVETPSFTLVDDLVDLVANL